MPSRLENLTFLIALAAENSICGSAGAQVPSDKILLQNFLKPAIVKIEVTFEKSKRDANNIELCASEGTGFIVDRKHIVTATHVYNFDPDCGQARIFAKSRFHESEWHLNPIDQQDDIALLKSDDDIEDLTAPSGGGHPHPCAMKVSETNVFDVHDGAVRYGIGKGLFAPTPIWGDIGSAFDEFAPLVKLTPTQIIAGESGGPVVAGAQVVGVVRATVFNNDVIGLMTPVSELDTLLKRNNITFPVGAECSILQFITFNTKVAPGLGKPFVVGDATVSDELLEGKTLSTEGRGLLQDTIQSLAAADKTIGSVEFTNTANGVEFSVKARGGGGELETELNKNFGRELTSRFGLQF